MFWHYYKVWSPVVVLAVVIAAIGFVIYNLLNSNKQKEGKVLILLMGMLLLVFSICFSILPDPYDIYQGFCIIAVFLWWISWYFLYYFKIYPRYIKPRDKKAR